jgi:hypothetical protein
MEQNTKIIIAAVGLGGLGYFLYKKGLFGKSAVMPKELEVSTTPRTINTPSKPIAQVYPSGYSEYDYVRNPSGDGTVYMLKKGQKLPLTYNWMIANAIKDWNKVKDMGAGLLMDIPTGTVLDA